MKHLKKLILTTVLFFSSCIYAEQILVLTMGDSLTAGDGDDIEGRGYPVRLESILSDRGISAKVRNIAISGDTSSDLIAKQLDPAVKELTAAGNIKKIALVWIGSNDMFGFYNYTAGEDWCKNMGPDACERSEMKTTAENIAKIVRELKKAGASVIVALVDDQTRRPVISEKKMRSEFFPNINDADVARMSKQIRLYNDSIKNITAKSGAATVDFFTDSVFYDKSMLGDDGNHPNSTGYDKIAQVWADAVISLLRGEQ